MAMMTLTNFSKGALAPELQARIDTAQYAAGCRQLRNFIIQRYGGASFRPGFRYVGELDSTATTPRYVPFQYNVEQAYVMVLDNSYMRLLALGGMVVEENVQITAITKAANALVTQPFHAYVVGDKIYFTGIVGMTELNGLFATVVTVPTANTYTININTTAFTTFVSSNGTLRSAPPTPPPAPPAPPPTPPAPTPPPDTGGGGGSGSDTGGGDNRYDDGTYR